MKDSEGETAQGAAERPKEEAIVKFLAAAAAGNIPKEAPAGKVFFLILTRNRSCLRDHLEPNLLLNPLGHN